MIKILELFGGIGSPRCAIGFRAAKTGGRYRYIWLLKCKFEVPGEKYKTKGEKIEFQTPEITATFYKRKKDAKWKADFVGTEKDKPATTWFTTVPEPAPKMTEV